MALLTQIIVYGFCILISECHLHFSRHIHEPHHQRLDPEDPVFAMISDLRHMYENFHQSDVIEDFQNTDDHTSRFSLYNDLHTGAIDDLGKQNGDMKDNVMDPALETRDSTAEEVTEIHHEFESNTPDPIKQQVKRASDKPEPEVKPSLEDSQDKDKDPHAIKYPGPQVELKTNLDNDVDGNATTPDSSNDKDDTTLTKNSDYFLIPITAYNNPSLSFASRFKNDETSGNPIAADSPQYSNAGVNQPPPVTGSEVQGPVANSDTYIQNSYNPNQGPTVHGNQPINQFDNTVPQIPQNFVPVPNSADNNMGNNPPHYTLVNVPNNLDPQGIPSNQYYILTNPQQNNPGYNSPPNYNLVSLNNQPNNMVPSNIQPNNMVPLYNQPNNNNMVPVYNNQPNNMVPVYNNQPNNMVPLNSQPNNLIYLKNQPNGMIPSNNQPNNFPGPSNVYPNYGAGMNNQPNNLILLNPQNNQPSNTGNYNGYGNQPNNFVPLNNQPSYLVHLDNLPNNFVPINNQPNNMATYPNPNQPTYWLVSNQPNNLGSYGNQPNNMAALNGGGQGSSNGNPIMLQPPSNNIPIYSMKDEADSGTDNDKEPTDEQ